MERRDFIKVTTAGSTVLLLPGLLSGCDNVPNRAHEIWSDPAREEQDIRMRVLSYAIMAPNPHNKQPWIIDLTGAAEMDLYVDPERLLPETDPPIRQIHIGQGTFLENLKIAAHHMGYRADITYFPEGMYGNTVLEHKPVANIALIKDSSVEKDPLFDHITARQSNKREYNDTPLPQSAIDTIKSAYNSSRYPITITVDSDKLTELADIAVQAMKLEAGDRDRDMETLRMFRFNNKEVERYRDGFSVEASGVTGIKKWVAETFILSRKSAEEDPTKFSAQAIELTKKQAASATAFGWITSPTNTRRDQIEVGHAYERVHLAATSAGVALHPMSQVLQEYDDMAELQRIFKSAIGVPETHTVQMFFRLGYAESTPHTPRRALGDFTDTT